MTYDPTINYGKKDLTIEENSVCHEFSELLKTLITLSSPHEKQVEIMGYGSVADEMATDFETYYSLSYQSYLNYKLLTFEQKQALDGLDKYLEERSGEKNPEFWDDSQLGINPEWEEVRKKAKEILKLLNRDDLAIEFERKEDVDATGNVVIQATKSRLVNKERSN
jgi:hypothetical protein